MKLFRLTSALFFLAALAFSVARAEDKPAGETKTDAACEKTCECPKDKDGKACGVDKDCCCTGKKAEKKAEEKKN